MKSCFFTADISIALISGDFHSNERVNIIIQLDTLNSDCILFIDGWIFSTKLMCQIYWNIIPNNCMLLQKTICHNVNSIKVLSPPGRVK